jgi:hypothetical protein
MVSLAGAQQARPIVQKITDLEASIASLKAVLDHKGTVTIWNMAADVYLDKASKALSLRYDVNAEQTTAVLNSVLTALQSELAAANAQLGAIV